MNRRRFTLGLVGVAASSLVAGPATSATAFDTTAWTALLRQNVVLHADGGASRVRYASLKADPAALEAVLAQMSAVSAATFQAWPRDERMAFLINAYNAFTVQLVLTRYPDLASIKDLGSLLSSPWKKRFVPLLGRTLSLDEIEHDMLRKRGAYDDPRLHFAVNCAAIGCPMLREEAYTAARLEAQLQEQADRFLGDRERNRYDAARQRLEVSRIFDWYGDDFRQGFRGIDSLDGYFAAHAAKLTRTPAGRTAVAGGGLPIGFLEYDWRLNDASR